MKCTAVVEGPDGTVEAIMTDAGEVKIPETKDIDRAELEQGAKGLFTELGITADTTKFKFANIQEAPEVAPEVTP